MYSASKIARMATRLAIVSTGTDISDWANGMGFVAYAPGDRVPNLGRISPNVAVLIVPLPGAYKRTMASALDRSTPEGEFGAVCRYLAQTGTYPLFIHPLHGIVAPEGVTTPKVDFEALDRSQITRLASELSQRMLAVLANY